MSRLMTCWIHLSVTYMYILRQKKTLFAICDCGWVMQISYLALLFQIKENASNGIHVENLTDDYVSTVEDVNQILMKV